jgi:tannase/feruloyl esterase
VTSIRIAQSALIAGCALLAANAAAAQNVCGTLAAKPSFPSTTIVAATPVAANPASRLPAFCEVHATITPVAASTIGAVYRLPANWNGKMLGIGGGGFAGNVRLDAAAEGLARGYAVIQNDLGHSSPDALDPSFTIDASGKQNVTGIVDFGHRATHYATAIGKEVAARLYGRAPERAYWQGCSTGGRQGLAEVQRYPGDYDGVIAGAPVYGPQVYANAMLRVQAFHAKPESNLDPAQVPLIRQAVLAACDAKDGLEDGILTDPRTCAWDPKELECSGSATSECLSPAQVETVRRVYAGVKLQDGRYAALPLMRGGEGDEWVRRMIGTPDAPRGINARLGAPFMAYVAKGNPSYDIMTFNPDRDWGVLDGGIAASDVHQQNPNIAAFVSRGGKLLLWHGFNDPGPSPLSTIAYYDAVVAAVPAAKDNVRLFLAPGVLHCRGGPGPDTFDSLTAIENWVERGVAPNSMLATKENGSLSRPLCAHPHLPRYKGTGDPNDAANFACAEAVR